MASPRPQLPDAVLALICAQPVLDLDDLLRLSLVSRRWRSVSQGEEPWRRLYAATFRDGDAAAACCAAGAEWRSCFKARFAENRTALARDRWARRHWAEGEAQLLRQQVHRLEQALAAAEADRRDARHDVALAAADAAARRRIGVAAAQRWVPRAVARGLEAPAAVERAQEPVDAEQHALELGQRLAAAEHEVRKLRNQAREARRRRGRAEGKLAALLPP